MIRPETEKNNPVNRALTKFFHPIQIKHPFLQLHIMAATLQQQFLERILQRFPKKSAAVDELSDIMGIGKDAVYRRLRGDTLLTPDEMAMLSRKFNVSLDAMVFEESDTVFMQFNAFTKESNNFEEFLSGFMAEMEKASDLPEYQFYYASVELPMFQSLFFPELIGFKMYIWGRTVLDFDYMQKTLFSFDLLPPPLLELINKMLKLYINLPSTELWSQNIIDNTLNQIEYHLSSGSFQDSEDALILCEKLTELTYHMQKMAEHGKKMALNVNPEGAAGAEFALYHNEMIHTNNTIMATTTEGKVMYTTLSNPNFLKSTDRRMCKFIDDWFKTVIVKASSISKQSERNREWFFNRLRKKIELSKHRIRVEVGMY